MQRETIRIADEVISAGLQTIIFGRSRRSVEFMLTRLQDRPSLASKTLRAYRSGYLASQRREIESGLRSGEIRGITATSALELGVDIGGLDACLLAGYPGSIAGAWQQAGRSGRGDSPSLAVLMLSSNPLDQYIGLHPDFLLASSPESALINADNLLIALSHLKCAAYELPFDKEVPFGSFTVEQTSQLLTALENMGKVYISDQKAFWMSDDYPAADISLRTTSPQQISLQLINFDGIPANLGTIDKESAFWMVHPGAIYLHQGISYRVDQLNLDQHKAILAPFEGDYYTEAVKKLDFKSLDKPTSKDIPGGMKSYGEIEVTSSVVSYKKISWKRYEVLGTESLSLPPSTLTSMGFWITLSEGTEAVLRDTGSWNSSPNAYGPDWEDIRREVLARDKHTCVMCGRLFPHSTLHVHHIKPFRSFSSPREANHLSNLISLCPRCHQRAETVVRVNSGVRGLGFLLHNLAPLLLMCDPGDLGLFTDVVSPLGDQRPIVLLYEHAPAGIGFSQFLFDHISDLLRKALHVVRSCPCQNGCPACVGPGGELGSGGKKETEAILSILSN